ncbi:MAG: sce7726 family protein [Chitinophagaceae bacterium]|nr:sce7726 family protein [Chitinophagaceae bacterium]
MNEISATPIDEKLVKLIAKTYNPLGYNDKLTQLLSSIYPSVCFKKWNKFELYKLINEVVINNHNGEQVLKYYLFQAFYKKKVVAAFEIKVNNSRTDFLSINGTTNNFEIKSSLDNLYKLKKQASDYLLAFEYNYLVIDEKHLENALELVPKSFGLWSFKNGRKKVHRGAALNNKIDAEIQLSLLTKKDLQHFFSEVDGNKKQILKCFHESEINHRFKSALKQKYQERWNFLVSNVDLILPIDLQFFFKTTINPEYIYYY